MSLKRLLSLCAAALLLVCLWAYAPAEEEEVSAEEAPAAVEVGAVIEFGHYEQDADTENGAEPIQWRVMAVEDGKALLVSDKALTARPFNDRYEAYSWGDSSLRAWLNGAFMDAAFSETERAAILETQVDNSAEQGYSEYATPSEAASASTADHVFLLSYAEIQQLFSGRSARRFQCELTAQAVADGAYQGTNNSFAWWWLRSPGAGEKDAAGMRNTGKVNHRDVNSASGAVRPAMWIDVEAAGFALAGD